MLKSEVLKNATASMLAFTKRMNNEFRINWHHRVMCAHLDKLERREITRLMIFVEPQTGKSELVSRHFPAYVLGRDPDHRFISASYGESFSSEFNIDVQRIMETEKYKSLFPETRIPEQGTEGKWIRNSRRFDIVGRRGRYYSVGVGGSLTGRTGYTFSIDDPVKNEEEARSQVYRDRQWRWLKTVARTRLKKDKNGRPGAILLTMTRWHHDDLAGRLLKEMKENPKLPKWTILNFPAIREDMTDPLDPRELGAPLWPENLNLDELVELQADPRTWTSLYMQRPSTAAGDIFKRAWWKTYTALPPKFDKVIQSWDLTFDETKKGSFVVGQVWGKVGPNKYLIHQFRERIGFTAQLDAFIKMTDDYPAARAKLVEKKANGAALINTLSKHISGIIPIEPHGSKENRAEAVSPDVRAGNVYLPDPSIASWVTDFIDECSEFPNGTNDDQVDAMSQALDYFGARARTDIKPGSLTGISKWNKV